jgi:cob(I)alamin adenosyltransferase
LAVKIYTKSGDAGETSLLFGHRVSKADPRCDAYGASDTAVSAMGLARALCENSRVKALLLQAQRDMFVVGSELATPTSSLDRLESRFGTVTNEMVESLEQAIDEVDAQIELPSAFLVPGGSAGSGALDLARSLVREAERRVVALGDDEIPNPHVLRYLNRLSDLLFMLARLEDKGLPFDFTKEG